VLGGQSQDLLDTDRVRAFQGRTRSIRARQNFRTAVAAVPHFD